MFPTAIGRRRSEERSRGFLSRPYLCQFITYCQTRSLIIWQMIAPSLGPSAWTRIARLVAAPPLQQSKRVQPGSWRAAIFAFGARFHERSENWHSARHQFVIHHCVLMPFSICKSGLQARPESGPAFGGPQMRNLFDGVGVLPRPGFPEPFTKGRATVPKQDRVKIVLLSRIGSAIRARRTERIAPFILIEAARVAAFFLNICFRTSAR